MRILTCSGFVFQVWLAASPPPRCVGLAHNVFSLLASGQREADPTTKAIHIKTATGIYSESSKICHTDLSEGPLLVGAVLVQWQMYSVAECGGRRREGTTEPSMLYFGLQMVEFK